MAVLLALAATACGTPEPQPMDPAETCDFMQEATGRPADEVCDPPLGRRGEPVIVIPGATTPQPATAVALPEQAYLDGLAAAGVPTTDTAKLVSAAEGVCAALDASSSNGDLIAAALVVAEVDGWTTDEAAQIAVTAVRTYCPEHESTITG